MADGKVKISELSQALQLNDNAVFPYTQDNGGTDTTFKAPMTQIARKINEDTDFTNLKTSNKKVVGAINQTLNNFAEEYDSTATYNTGDPTLYAGTLYKCKADNVTGTWDSSKWEVAKAVEFGSGGGGASYATELPISSTDPTDTKSYIDDKTTLVKSASGDLITISDGGDNIPLKSCEVTIEPIQASGTPTPDNPLPISGHTECNLVVCGANLIKKQALMQRVNLPSGTTIYAKLFNFSGQFNLYGLKKGLSDIPANWSALLMMGSDLRSVTLTDDYDYIGISSGAYSDLGAGEMQVSTYSFTTFSLYNGNNYTFTFGQTVYGGSGNALTGEFVSEWGKYTITNDTELTNYTTSAMYGSYARVSQIGIQKIDNTNIMAFCDVATGISFEQRTATANERRVYIEDTGYVVIRAAASDNITSLEDLKNLFMGANICYVLATPTSLSLTPVNPKTISGINNIYNDCGSTEIEYFTESADGLAALINVLSTS